MIENGGILDACAVVDQGVCACVIDAPRMIRVFDSGLGLLMMFCLKVSRSGVPLIVVRGIPGLPAIDALPEAGGGLIASRSASSGRSRH